MAKCPKCGEILTKIDDGKFECPGCGKKFTSKKKSGTEKRTDNGQRSDFSTPKQPSSYNYQDSKRIHDESSNNQAPQNIQVTVPITQEQVENIRHYMNIGIKPVLVILMIIFFCPTMMVSCMGERHNLAAVNVAVSIKDLGWLAPIHFILLIIPCVLLFLSFKRDARGKFVAMVLSFVDLVGWILYANGVDDICKQYYSQSQILFPWYINQLFLLLCVLCFADQTFGFLSRFANGNPVYEPVQHERPQKQTLNNEHQTTGFTMPTINMPSIPSGVITKGAVIVVAVIIVITGGLFISEWLSYKTVNTDDYIDITFSGMNGEGTAYVDVEPLNTAIFTSGKNSAEEYFMEGLTGYNGNIVTANIEPSSELSNGDVVKVTLDVDRSSAKQAKVRVKGKTEFEYTVEGLEDYTHLDPFDPAVFNVTEGKNGVIIDYEGIAPNASIRIRNNISKSDPRSKLTYTADKTYGIQEGDSITITASLSYEDAAKTILDEEETVIECDNVAHYIQSLDELDASTIERIKSDAADLTAQYIDVLDNRKPIIVKGKNYDRYPDGPDDDYYKDFGFTENDLDYDPNFRYTTAITASLKDGIDSGWSYNYVAIEYEYDSNKVLYADGFIDNTTVWDGGMVYGYYLLTDVFVDQDGKADYKLGTLKICDKQYSDQKEFDDAVVNEQKNNYTFVETDISDWN